MRRRYVLHALVGLALGLVAARAESQLSPDGDALVRKTYLNRAKALRVEAGEEEILVALVPGSFRPPRAPAGAIRFRSGDVVRISEVSSDGGTVVFRFGTASAPGTGAVRFSFPEADRERLASGEELLAAAASLFDPLARLGSAAEDEPDEERPMEPGEPEPTPEPEESPEPREEELRLLVEPGRALLKGDGDDTTTLTITLRDADGRIVESRNGPVEVRRTCGRLVPERPVMVRGRAVANLTAPIWGDEDRALDRSLELSIAVIRRLASFRGDAKAEAIRVARESPSAELRSPAKGHKPEILIVAEAFDVKGKARVELGASSTPRSGVYGTYEGKDVLGAATWVFEGSLAKGVLRQKGYREEIPVTASNENGGMGFVGVSVGGIGTSARPLPGGRFFLVAPPILFERVSAATAQGPAPKPEKKPSVTLTARTNPVAADGKSSTEVVFQYLDETGHPVSGLLVEWSLDLHGVFPDREKGQLYAAQERTGDDGAARAFYRAPTLEAGDMQQTGTLKNRDVTATYAGPKGKGSVTCEIGLLRAAALVLVVEKPGVDRSVFPLRVGSLNGTITGTVLLENVAPRGPGAPSRYPLADAVVKLDGDPRVLKWAAVDPGTTDAKGRFRVRMRMSNWPRWDKAFDEPLVVRASPLFLGRLGQCRKHLDEWPSSPELLLEKAEFLYRAQGELAALPAGEAKGLDEKLRLAGLLTMTLKDARKDGTVAAKELLSHGQAFLVGVASWFYSDSQLEKAVGEKVKALEGTAGVTELRRKYARWLRGAGRDRAQRVLAWLSSKVGLAADLPRDALGVRSAFRKVLVPKLLEALSGAVAEWVPESSLGDLATERMLSPFVERGNRVLLAFLKNRDYPLVAATATTSGAHLGVHLGRMREEVLKVAAWRLEEETAKAFLDAGTEWVTLSMKVAAALTLNDAVWKAAEAVEKGKEKLDTGIAAIRMGEEWHRLSGILAASEEEARECVVRSAGVALPTASLGLPSGEGALRADLLDFGSKEGDAPPELATLFAGASGADDLLVRISLAREVSETWLVDALPSLLALKEVRPEEAAALASAFDRWMAAEEAGRRDALATSAGQGGRPPAEIASALAAAAKEQDEAARAAVNALRAIPRDESLLRLAEAERRAGVGLPFGARASTFVAGGAGLVVVAGLVVALAAALSRRASGASRPQSARTPRTSAPAEAPPARPGRATGPALPSPRPEKPVLVDGLGQVHSLDPAVVTIGASRSNDVVVTQPGVSRAHARIVRGTDGSLVFEDLGSRFGSKVNGGRVTRVRISNGDEIALGSWRAVVHLGGPARGS